MKKIKPVALLTPLFLGSVLSSPIALAVSGIVAVDDYPTVQDAINALTSGATLWFGPNTYNTSGIVIATANVRITGAPNATLRSMSALPVLKVTSANVTVEGLAFDMNDSAQYGIEASGTNFKAYDNYVYNGYYATSTIAAIHYANGPGPAWIQNNRIYDIDTVTTGETGSGSGGASRGIWVQISSLADTASIYISGNNIERIAGREGDGIHVQSDDPLSTAKVYVENNVIKDVNRRAIKTQAQNAFIAGNTHVNTLTAVQLANAEAVIEAFQPNTQIVDNAIDASLFGKGIVVQKGDSSVISNAITAPIAIKLADNLTPTRAIYATSSTAQQNLAIVGNRIVNPAGTTIDLSAPGSGYVVANNSIDVGAISGGYGIRLFNVDDSAIVNNFAFSDTNAITYLIELKTNSDHNVVTGNAAQFPDTIGNYDAVELTSGNNSVIANNTTNCGTFNTIHGSAIPNNTVFGNVNLSAPAKTGNP